MRVVLDTNVFVAAFITDGLCSKILVRARRGQFFSITSPYILNEFTLVLRKKLKASNKETQESLELISETLHEIVDPGPDISGICRDPKDDAILDCAVSGKAEYIVSGDSDLLDIKRYRGIRILSPREFELLFED